MNDALDQFQRNRIVDLEKQVTQLQSECDFHAESDRAAMEQCGALHARIAQLESFVPVRGRVFEAVKEMFRSLQAFEKTMLERGDLHAPAGTLGEDRAFQALSPEALSWCLKVLTQAHNAEGTLGPINAEVLSFTNFIADFLEGQKPPTPDEVQHAKGILRRHIAAEGKST